MLLTSRIKITGALVVTALVLALAIWRGIHFHTASGWLLPLDFVFRGRLLLIMNVAFYVYLWWLAFLFIRGTAGPERVFMVGWFANILLSPTEALRPRWAGPIRYVGIFGLLVALLASLSLLLQSSSDNDRGLSSPGG